MTTSIAAATAATVNDAETANHRGMDMPRTMFRPCHETLAPGRNGYELRVTRRVRGAGPRRYSRTQ